MSSPFETDVHEIHAPSVAATSLRLDALIVGYFVRHRWLSKALKSEFPTNRAGDPQALLVESLMAARLGYCRAVEQDVLETDRPFSFEVWTAPTLTEHWDSPAHPKSYYPAGVQVPRGGLPKNVVVLYEHQSSGGFRHPHIGRFEGRRIVPSFHVEWTLEALEAYNSDEAERINKSGILRGAAGTQFLTENFTQIGPFSGESFLLWSHFSGCLFYAYPSSPVIV